MFSVPSYSSDGPPTYSSLNITAPDSDLEVEQDLPPLELVIPKEHLKRLEKKEKKRQEVINGRHISSCQMIFMLLVTDEDVLRAAARMSFDVPWFFNITEYMQDTLHWLPVQQCIHLDR